MEKQKMDRKQEKFKILKFGGTSLGTVERIKHVANLICNNELNLVVLSAMSGTTNSLAEIASLLFNGDIDGAQRDIKRLESKYIEVADKLYLSAKSIEEAKKFILCSFIATNNSSISHFFKTRKNYTVTGRITDNSTDAYLFERNWNRIGSASCD